MRSRKSKIPMNPGGQMKPGQVWTAIRDHKYNTQPGGDSFTVLYVDGRSASIQWINKPSPETVVNEPGLWSRNYRLNESYSVTEILSKYES